MHKETSKVCFHVGWLKAKLWPKMTNWHPFWFFFFLQKLKFDSQVSSSRSYRIYLYLSDLNFKSFNNVLIWNMSYWDKPTILLFYLQKTVVRSCACVSESYAQATCMLSDREGNPLVLMCVHPDQQQVVRTFPSPYIKLSYAICWLWSFH